MYCWAKTKIIIALSVALIVGTASCAAEDAHDPLLPIMVGGKVGLADQTGAMVVEPEFLDIVPLLSENLTPASVEKGVGFIGRNGDFVVLPMYDMVERFRLGLAPVKDGENWYYIDTDGKVALPGPYQRAFEFQAEGVAVVKQNNAYRLIDAKGSAVSVAVWPAMRAKATEGLIPAKVTRNTWGYVTSKGKIALATDFPSAGYFSNGMAAVRSAGGKYGYVDRTGNVAIKPRFQYARDFGENGLAAVLSADRYGYVDKSGKWAITPRFRHGGRFVCGLAPAQDAKTGKFGYIDEDGDWAIPPRFALAMDFLEEVGQARVYTGREDSNYIDKQGSLLWVGGASAAADAREVK